MNISKTKKLATIGMLCALAYVAVAVGCHSWTFLRLGVSSIPFNLIKGGLNAAITMLLYKPVVTVMRRSNVVETRQDTEKITTE